MSRKTILWNTTQTHPSPYIPCICHKLDYRYSYKSFYSDIQKYFVHMVPSSFLRKLQNILCKFHFSSMNNKKGYHKWSTHLLFKDVGVDIKSYRYACRKEKNTNMIVHTYALFIPQTITRTTYRFTAWKKYCVYNLYKITSHYYMVYRCWYIKLNALNVQVIVFKQLNILVLIIYIYRDFCI